MKKKGIKSNKGFTLVELIVVLVILAILAAILVPALLGYIDSARNKQTLLNARSAMTAAQAELSAIYGTSTGVPGDIEGDTVHNANLRKTADFGNLTPTPIVFEVACEEKYPVGEDGKLPSGTTRKDYHKAFTVNYVHYKDESAEVWYFNGEWVDNKEGVTEPTEALYKVLTEGSGSTGGGTGTGG